MVELVGMMLCFTNANEAEEVKRTFIPKHEILLSHIRRRIRSGDLAPLRGHGQGE